MRRLILGTALLALAAPALAQDYGDYRRDDRPAYGDRDRGSYDYDRGDDNGRGYDYDRDGDYDARDRYYAERDVDRDGDYDRRDRYLAGQRDYRGSGWSVGRAVPAQLNYSGSWIVNPWKFGLPQAPRYTHWVRVRSDALLVRNRDRVILRVVRNAV